jgi:hypothetical protein
MIAGAGGAMLVIGALLVWFGRQCRAKHVA